MGLGSNVAGVVTGAQGQPTGEGVAAVEVKGGRLHPRVVRITGVVDVAAVYLLPSVEERVEAHLEQRLSSG